MKKNLSVFVGVIALILMISAGYYVRKNQIYISAVHLSPQSAMYVAEKSKTNGLAFIKNTKEMGIDFTFRTPKFDDAMMHRIDTYYVGSGSAVGDVNGDGFMDIFIPAGLQGDKNHLYINQGGERFVEQAEAWGVADNPPEVANTHPVFFDSDNTGRPDLLLMGAGCSRFYRNTGNAFEQVTDSGLTDCRNSMSGIVLDYDNDGLLDVYVLRYWPEVNLFKLPHYNVYVNNLTDADNGGDNTLYRNLGNGKFADVTKETHTGNTHWSYDATYGDFRNEGKLALYIANDYGPDSYYEVGKERWHDISKHVLKRERRYGMNASIMDQGSANPMVYISNGYLGPPFDITGNFSWQFDQKSRKGNEISMQKNLFNCGFAWGGLPADFNLDGYQDLYVSNGFISNGPAPGSEEFAKPTADNRGEFTELSARTLPGAVSSDIRKWPNLSNKNSFSYQRDCLFINARNEVFLNKALPYGIDDELRDNRSAAGIDIRNDGAISILSKPRRGPVTLYNNQVKAGKHWVGFSLVGTSSNRMGAGARVTITQNGVQQYRWNTAGHSGIFTTSDPRIHFGLADETAVDVDIRWPSGKQQHLSNVEPGRYHEVIEK